MSIKVDFRLVLVLSYRNLLLGLIGKAAVNDESSFRSQRGVYGISVTSELSGVSPQTLRLYESRGLLTPARTEGGTRRYSDDDLDRLARITELLATGVNLAGVAQILGLEARNSALQSDNTQLESDNSELRSRRSQRTKSVANRND
ncbi:MAG: MerR family transcriptional regulator, heat shock protein HspR [Mycobacterium sp.]|jgi:MerR family transcriptional regulator/heat shock protein HspR|nr:MerR family transcriptional regulator, heat shock protein HspR [Mycobacterium sp.]